MPVQYETPVCPDGPEHTRCMVRAEAAAMAAAGGRVSRSGDTLVIRGADGGRLALGNVAEPESHTRVFRYDRFMPEIGVHLVEIGHYEGGAWLLVDARTTDQTHVLGRPVVSPGRTRFAAAGLDLEAMYDPNGLQVWRVTEHGPRMEWGIDGGDQWGADGLAWAGEDALYFTRHDPTADPGRTLQRRMRLTLQGPGLTLAPAPR
jgi:hypothetical protein